MMRMFVALLYAVLITARVNAVVNKSPAGAGLATKSNSDKLSETNEANIADSIAESSEPGANRRDAPIVPHEVYGPPDALHNNYGPPSDGFISTAPNNPSLPVPIYGVPDDGSSSVVYPAPPADIIPSPPNFGPPKAVYGPPKNFYGQPPKNQYGPPRNNFGPPKPLYGPPLKYGPPLPGNFPKLPKPAIPGPFFKPKPFHGPPPKAQYGPPSKPFFKPKPIYGLPKIQYGIPKPLYGAPPKQSYGPPKQFGPSPTPIYGTPPQKNYGPPLAVYGPPKLHTQSGPVYGPPDPVPHGPPHPGAPAPPTPPDIKYDGWLPIPGLISRPPSDSYGVPHSEPHGHVDLQVNNDFVPPPAIGKGLSSLSLGSSYGTSAGISDSYGAPLNTVTGTGSIISTSGDAHIQNQDHNAISLGLSAAGIGGGHNGQLSVVKSIGYEIFPNGEGGQSHSQNHGHSNSLTVGGDTYGAPLTHSPSFNIGNPTYQNIGFGKALTLSSSGIGLIPPNGLYGVPPSSQYGTPLLSKSPAKQPILYRDPVPPGLIQSIGNHIIQSEAVGTYNGPQYSPPPVADPKPPSSLYSLPTSYNSIQFQSLGTGTPLTSYNTQLGNIDNTYGVPTQNGQPIDQTHLGTNSFHNNIAHDCGAHKYQPLPQLSFGVPSATSYTASLSSLTTNIGANAVPPLSAPLTSYGSSDLQTAYTAPKDASVNALNSVHGDSPVGSHSKSVAEDFAPGSELIKSQSIDFNNIPLQGAYGSYTLQIQPADGATGTGGSSVAVPHDQVLNDGLLQSILAAIEQPQQKTMMINTQNAVEPIGLLTTGATQSQPTQLVLNHDFQLPSENLPIDFSKQVDDEGQHSQQVVVVSPQSSAPSSEAAISKADTQVTNKPPVEVGEDASVQLIDDNEIALYFNNNPIVPKPQEVSAETPVADGDKNDAVRDGKSGSFVSFQAPSASYTFGDLKSTALTLN